MGVLFHAQVLVEDVTALDNCARVFHRWAEVLECGPGAWPELARRWVLLQEQDQLASPEGEQPFFVLFVTVSRVSSIWQSLPTGPCVPYRCCPLLTVIRKSS